MAAVFTGPGALATYIKPSCSGANQALNYDSTLRQEGCVTISSSALSGTLNKFVLFGSSTTGVDSIMSQSGTNVSVAGTLTVGTGPYLGITPTLTVDRTWTAQDTNGLILPCDTTIGNYTDNHVLKVVKVGTIVTCADGGAAGTGTWTDSSTNTATNKTLVATGAGGTNTITTPLRAYWDAGAFNLPASSTCTPAVLTQINSGPSAYTMTCTDASTSSFEGSLTPAQTSQR